MASVSLSAPKLTPKLSSFSDPTKPNYRPSYVAMMMMMKPKTWQELKMGRVAGSPGRWVRVGAVPESLSEKVAESIKEAEEACSENPASGECVAAWDEVEELSAAASHARDRQRATNPLEEFCKDNPEDEECRTYED